MAKARAARRKRGAANPTGARNADRKAALERKERKRAADREREARYRARRRLEREAAELAQAQASEAPTIAAPAAEAPIVAAPIADASPTVEAPAPVRPPSRDRLALALAGTWEAIAATVAAGVPNAPALGDDRADALGDLWAAALEPYVSAHAAEWMPIAIAVGGTARILAPWVRDVQSARKRAPAKVSE
jgi:hypothetical protein